jgi:hypothetical protein
MLRGMHLILKVAYIDKAKVREKRVAAYYFLILYLVGTSNL